MSKTNIDHLRDLISDNEEANEFLEAIEKEIMNLDSAKESALDDLANEELRSDRLDDELGVWKEFQKEMTTIKGGIGTIEYRANNLQLKAIMEALEEKLRTKSPNEITAAIESL